MRTRAEFRVNFLCSWHCRDPRGDTNIRSNNMQDICVCKLESLRLNGLHLNF